jgi:hypothetical protein
MSVLVTASLPPFLMTFGVMMPKTFLLLRRLSSEWEREK